MISKGKDIMAIKYSDLAKQIQALEAQFGGNSTVAPASLRGTVHPGTTTAAGNIPANGDGNFQVFALDNQTNNTDLLPVVVAVGINYSQGSNTLPTSPPNWPGVEEKLAACRTNANHVLRNCIGFSSQKIWVASGFRSVTPPRAFKSSLDFHLVFTNFCPWITNLNWSDKGLSSSDKAELLLNLGSKINFGIWQHLQKLKFCLDEDIECWMGHTLGAPVSNLFSQFVAGNSIKKWVISPNLARGNCSSWEPNSYL